MPFKEIESFTKSLRNLVKGELVDKKSLQAPEMMHECSTILTIASHQDSSLTLEVPVLETSPSFFQS